MQPERLTSTTENPSAFGSGTSNSNLPSLPTAQPAAKTKTTKAPRKKWDCFGFWPHWKRLPRSLRWILIVLGIFVYGFVAVFGVISWKTGKARIEKEEQRQREIERLDVGNALTQQVSVMALAGRFSEISLPPAMTLPIVISPTPFTTAPARRTFLTHVHITMSTNGINLPTPSAEMAITPSKTSSILSSNSTQG